MSIDDTEYSSLQAPFKKNTNLSLAHLTNLIPSESEWVYFYVVTTIKNHGGRFVQTGSAPNFEGGYITLCTCKHQMRTFFSPEEWLGKWVAGFSTTKASGGAQAIVYLMKIGMAFESFDSLWRTGSVPKETKSMKLATAHRQGDFFKPLPGNTKGPFDPEHYSPPVIGHCHYDSNKWHGDIAYPKGKRPPALLIGDPKYSFTWDTPSLFFPKKIPRGQSKLQLSDFLNRLNEMKNK